MIVSLAIILEDVAVLAVGTTIGVGGLALIVTIGAALASFVKDHL